MGNKHRKAYNLITVVSNYDHIVFVVIIVIHRWILSACHYRSAPTQGLSTYSPLIFRTMLTLAR